MLTSSEKILVLNRAMTDEDAFTVEEASQVPVVCMCFSQLKRHPRYKWFVCACVMYSEERGNIVTKKHCTETNPSIQ
jgi:hypothetical protein